MIESQKSIIETQMIHLKNSLNCKTITNHSQENPRFSNIILKSKIINHGIESKMFRTDKKL